MYAEIAKALKSIGSPRILIIGDLMLDEFLLGSVGRISPEAPTPILSYNSKQQQLGGAGFTANVLAQLGAQVEVCALTGDDETRQSIIELLDKYQKQCPDPPKCPTFPECPTCPIPEGIDMDKYMLKEKCNKKDYKITDDNQVNFGDLLPSFMRGKTQCVVNDDFRRQSYQKRC